MLDQDTEWVNLMASVPDATTIPEGLPLAIVLEIPVQLSSHDPSIDVADAAAARDEFIKTIRFHLANNQSVLVRKWYPDQRCGFSVEEIGMICPFMKQEVHWQGG